MDFHEELDGRMIPNI